MGTNGIDEVLWYFGHIGDGCMGRFAIMTVMFLIGGHPDQIAFEQT